MCGIAGHFYERGLGDAQAVATRMAAQLRHRGPDGAACHRDDRALLVHTRLSIIDLETGAQPLHNEDKTIWLVCNGEIFNYLELRADLEARGHHFHTRSDCEVIVHLYEECGLDFVNHLNGQFAIALWDSKKGRAVLVRDRLGIAPLYFAKDRGGLWFGSEVKAIVAGRQQRPQLDADAFNQLLHFWAPVSPRTLFEGVSEVSPGQMLIFEAGRLNRHQYWDLDFPRHGEYAALSVDQAAGELRAHLAEATRLRLRADVPVAAYLSGGLDSSVIASMVSEVSSTPLKTYSLTFSDPGLDESRFQAEVVEALGTRHASVHCDDDRVAQGFCSAVWHAESPLVRTAPIPMAILSGLVQGDGTRVVLTGEGADEVLGGYDIFKETKLRHFWAANPRSNWRPLLVRRLYPYLNLSRGSASDYLARFFGSGVDDPGHPLFSHQPRMATTSRAAQFLSPAMRDRFAISPEQSLVNSLPAGFDGWSWLGKAQYLEMKTLMSGYLLSTQGDRMLMQHGVEGRFPFLDHHLVEFANSLDPRLKMRVLKEKFILKRAMAGALPEKVMQRYKQPYRAPMAQAFIGQRESDYLRYLLSEGKLTEYGYFDPGKVAMLMKKARSGRMHGYADNMALVLILSTQCWHQQFIEEFPARFGTATATSGHLRQVA